MMLKSAFLFALTGFFVGTRAIAIDKPDINVNSRAVDIPDSTSVDLVVLSWQDIPGVGNLTFWGPDPSSTNPPEQTKTRALTKRCGANSSAGCSGSHQAYTIQCQQLVNNLASSSGVGVNEAPRSICLSSSSTCCVSWHNPAPGLVEGDLVSSAQESINECGGNGMVSNKRYNVNLAGVCTQQCLSNRAGGC